MVQFLSMIWRALSRGMLVNRDSASKETRIKLLGIWMEGRDINQFKGVLDVISIVLAKGL